MVRGMTMMLFWAVVFIVVATLIYDAVARKLDRMGSDCWWWFENEHVAKGSACIAIFGTGIIIAWFGSWPEAIVASVWFGNVVFMEAKHLRP